MNKKLKVSDLEEGKVYNTFFHFETHSIEKVNGDMLVDGEDDITDILRLDRILQLEFEEVREQGFNPYESSCADYFEWLRKEDELRDKLKRFSYENGGSEIDWKNWEQDKYHITVDFEHGMDVRWVRHIKDLGQVYFISKEVAKQALEKYRDLIEEVYFQNKY